MGFSGFNTAKYLRFFSHLRVPTISASTLYLDGLGDRKVIDVLLVKSNEVARSTIMELEGLKKGPQQLEDAGLHVQTIVTDRHGMVKKFMRTEHHDKKHFFDVWHMVNDIA